MDHSKLKVGIIGAGTMGSIHAKIAAQSGYARVSHIFDIDLPRAKLLAEPHNAIACCEIDEIIKAELDLVFVCVPNKHHAQTTIRALEYGLNVFCEKPLAVSVEEVFQIRAAAEKANRRVFVGLNRRFSPVYLKAKETVSASKFKPTQINIIQNDGDMMSSEDLKNLGGFLFDTTVHFLDMAEYLLGEIVEIRALGMSACYNLQDNFAIQMRFKNGQIGAITTCGHASWIFPFERIQVIGDHCSVITEELDIFKYCPGLGKTISVLDFSKLSLEEKWGYKPMHYHIYEALLKNISVLNGVEQGIRSVALAEACYASADDGGTAVKINSLL